MNEIPKPEAEAIVQPEMPVRKPWHEPLFYEAGLAETYAMHNAGTDGASSAPSLS
jgi:hypothetical protein